SRARTCARTTCVREGDSAGPATSCESARATWRGGRAEATPAARRGQRAEEEETMNETLKTSEMTAGMMGWRAGLGMAREVSAARRAALVAIVSRLLCAEHELRTWIAETDPTLLTSAAGSPAGRSMADGLRRGLLDAVTRPGVVGAGDLAVDLP